MTEEMRITAFKLILGPISVLLMICTTVGSVFGQTEVIVNSWNTVTPLKTIRATTDSLFGKAISSTPSVSIYDTDTERITVWFNSAAPASNNPCSWDVSEDTVVSFLVVSKTESFISESRIDIRTFVREQSRELESEIQYLSLEYGISINATRLEDGRELIRGIRYFPTENDKKEKCIPRLSGCDGRDHRSSTNKLET